MNGEIPIWVLQLLVAAALGVLVGYLLKKKQVTPEEVEKVKHFIIDVVMPYAQSPVKELLEAAVVVLKFYTGEMGQSEAVAALSDIRIKAKCAVGLGEWKERKLDKWFDALEKCVKK